MAYWEWSECHQESGPQRSIPQNQICGSKRSNLQINDTNNFLFFLVGMLSYGILGMIRVSSRKWSPKKLTSRSHIPACIVLIGFWCTSENMWWHSVKKLCTYYLSKYSEFIRLQNLSYFMFYLLHTNNKTKINTLHNSYVLFL